MNSQEWFKKRSHDSWSVFKVMGELVEGYERLSEIGPCISIFGSARTKPENYYYKETIKIVYKINFKDLNIMLDLKLLIELYTKIGKRIFMIHKLLLIFTSI